MEAKKNEEPTKLRIYNTEERAKIDGDLTKKSVDYMKRQVDADSPFFLFIPYTQTHMPMTPDPEFKGSTKNGDVSDVLNQVDTYIGRLMKQVEDLGIADNTIFIFTSDNGPDPTFPHSSFAGPWSGSYFTGKEGSLRVPFIIRWPNKIPAGSQSNEIVHQMDLFPTLAGIIDGNVPSDRIIDGVDQMDFFKGTQEESNREHVIVYVGNDLYGIKWRNYKMMSKEIDQAFADPTRTYGVPLFYDLHLDPKEEHPLYSTWYEVGWIRWPAGQHVVDHAKSLMIEPPIRPGTLDPYTPKN